MIILHGHFKLIKIVLSEMQRKFYLLEQKDLRLDVLRKDISGLHCIVEDIYFGFSCSQTQEVVDYCDPESEVEVTVTREGMATCESLGRLSVLYSDILTKAPDAREAVEELDYGETAW